MAFKEIDPERTGMITSKEMDDIFRHFYPAQFKEKHLFEILKPFEVISNKILIEYGKYRTWLILELNKTSKLFDLQRLELAKEVLAARQALRGHKTSGNQSRRTYDTISKRSGSVFKSVYD